MSKPAVRHLSKVDPVMRALIRRVGPCGLAIRNQQPFETLVRAVAHQQIHGRAAEAILGRFIALFPGRGFPAPAAVAAMPVAKMRRAGLLAREDPRHQATSRARRGMAACPPAAPVTR